MHYLSVGDVLEIHARLMEAAGTELGVLDFSTDEQFAVVLGVAGGDMTRAMFLNWLRSRIAPRPVEQ
jgi:hypothetical protein